MSRQARVGLVVIGGLVLFMLVLFAVANRSFLFSDTFFIKARYSSVAGLNSGAQVQFQGVNVGRVESVRLPEQPGEKIVVTMAIRESAQHLITTNTQAQIKTDGLVGNQIVVLVNPPIIQAAETVEPGDFILGVEPFDVYEITDKMLSTVAQFDSAASTFQEMMVDVRRGEGTLGKLVYDDALYNEFVATTNSTRRTMNNLAANAEALVELAQDATAGVGNILNKVDEGDGTLAMMLNDPAVYNTLLATADTLQGISEDLRSITYSAENAANWGALGAFRFAELMEAAKSNWLFKRYFEERGYMEKADFEQREEAIAQSFREIQRQRRELLEWQERLERREETLEAAPSDTLATRPTGADTTSAPLGASAARGSSEQ